MNNSIVRKLTQLLSAPIDTEANAVYLFCEVRKLFDKRMPSSVNMFANWAVHVNLDRNVGVQKFLKDVDDFVGEFAEQGSVPLSDWIIRELAFVGSFRQDLRECFASENLPTKLCDDDAWWFAFIQAYAGVIEDGELTWQGRGLRNIKKLVFRKGRALEGADLPFQIEWKIVLSDGQTLEAEFHTIPEAGKALVWGFKMPPGFVLARQPTRKEDSKENNP